MAKACGYMQFIFTSLVNFEYYAVRLSLHRISSSCVVVVEVLNNSRITSLGYIFSGTDVFLELVINRLPNWEIFILVATLQRHLKTITLYSDGLNKCKRGSLG